MANGGVDIRFEINTRPFWLTTAGAGFDEFKRTSVATDSLTPSAYREWLSEADALLIAYNFDDASKTYVRYSLANKLPECLASGAPIVAHGPADVATIGYLRSLKCAVVVSEDNETALEGALRALVGDSVSQYELSMKARAIAFDVHHVHRVRGALRAELLALAERRRAEVETKLAEAAKGTKRKSRVTAVKRHQLRVAAGCASAVFVATLAYAPMSNYRALAAGAVLLLAWRVIRETRRHRRIAASRSGGLEEGRAYLKTLSQIRDTARALPPDATVVVISKGDERLLDLDGRRAWHFPQTENGSYTGYHPANSAAAIDHLEALRLKGGDFLLVPNTAFWWFTHFAKFKEHLDTRYHCISSPDCCMIYALSSFGEPNGQAVNESEQSQSERGTIISERPDTDAVPGDGLVS